jgi:hypothetical protein
MADHVVGHGSLRSPAFSADLRGLDLYGLGRVTEIVVRETDLDVANLEITAVYGGSDVAECRIRLRFIDIRTATLPALRPTFYLTELEIEDILSHQIEGVRYRAVCHGPERFEVLARGLELHTVNR